MLGVDIIEIERIEEAYRRFGKRFLQRLYTKKEQEYCLKKAHPAPSLAGRFAAKEAVAKALGIGFTGGFSFGDIEIVDDEKGKPIAYLSKEAQRRFPNFVAQLSISHCRSYAVAVCILEAK